MHSLTIGEVTSNYDKEQPGKVKISLPRLSGEGDLTAWIPVMSQYAGAGYGHYWIPEVGDSVIVGFLDADAQSPVVLGSYWNKKNKLPDGLAVDKNENKVFKSKKGHTIAFSDADKGSVTITTKDGLKISLTDEDKKITVSSKDGKAKLIINGDGNKLEISGDGGITLKGGDLTLEGNNISFKGKSIALKSDGELKLEGKTVALKGTSAKLEGTSLEAKGSTVKIESSSMLTLKGSMTKIN